jgi:transposase
MARQFITVDYAATLKQTVTLEECLPTDHLARFIVGVVALLDLKAIYAGYAAVGGAAFAPELLLGLLFYGYATGVFSSRKLETATYEAIPVRFIAGGLHPDHDTLAHFRKTFLPQISELFVQVLLVAADLGVLKVGQINVSFDGSKIHADASKSHAVSYDRLRELEQQLRDEVAELLALGAQADQAVLPAGLDIGAEVARRQQRLGNLAAAKQVLEARAAERYAAEQADYAAKLLARQAKTAARGHKLGGRPPVPPTPGIRPADQYNFTDPDSRIMKNSTDQGFDQAYNAQAVVDQATLLVVGNRVTNHPNDKNETLPDLDAVPAAVGRPQAAAGDHGFYSAANIVGLAERGIAPYLATGREPHHQNWREYFAAQPTPPPADASPIVQMAYKLRTELGQAIYRLRKCTVEPVFGIIKETLGFRQFSLRGLVAVAGEWCLVCLAFNLKRLHVLTAN